MRAIALCAGLVLLGACGERAAAPAAGPGSPVTSSPGSPTFAPTPKPRIVEPVRGLVHVRRQPWESAKVLDPRTVRVAFYNGVEDCYGLARVDVREGPDQVEITVFVGEKPGDSLVCIDIAELQATLVTLEQPVGDREVVDGSTVA
jgi:hypothetical protein